MISAAAHILAMSAVSIITPGDLFRSEPFTRVDFLGSILKKDVFDIMMEGGASYGRGPYPEDETLPYEDYLEVSVPRRIRESRSGSYEVERRIDRDLSGLNYENKIVPDAVLLDHDTFSAAGWMSELSGGEADPVRRPVHKPDRPYVIRGLYGYSDEFAVVVRARVSPGGRVLSAEPVTTTGYPELDLRAAEYVRGWMFEPLKDGGGADEWIDVEITLRAGE